MKKGKFNTVAVITAVFTAAFIAAQSVFSNSISWKSIIPALVGGIAGGVVIYLKKRNEKDN